MRQIVPFLIAGVLGGGLPAGAQTEPVPVFNDSVVVSAPPTPEDRQEVPASTTVFDQREIAARQANDLSDLVSTAPGIALVQAGPAGQQTSLFTRGTSSVQTLLLWNGIARVIDPADFQAYDWADWSQLRPADGEPFVQTVRQPLRVPEVLTLTDYDRLPTHVVPFNRRNL